MPRSRNGQQTSATDPTTVPVKRLQISNRMRTLINSAFADSAQVMSGRYPDQHDEVTSRVQAQKKEVMAYINGLLKNRKPVG